MYECLGESSTIILPISFPPFCISKVRRKKQLVAEVAVSIASMAQRLNQGVLRLTGLLLPFLDRIWSTSQRTAPSHERRCNLPWNTLKGFRIIVCSKVWSPPRC